MISEEKLMMQILRDYYICRLYVQTYNSTRNISDLTNISLASIKRALHLISERKKTCLKLLPKAFIKAIDDGIITSGEYIDEVILSNLQDQVNQAALELKSQSKWLSSSNKTNKELIRIIKDINDKYYFNSRDVSITKEQVKKLKEAGKSFGAIATQLKITKSTAYNYYMSGKNTKEGTDLGEVSAKKR